MAADGRCRTSIEQHNQSDACKGMDFEALNRCKEQAACLAKPIDQIQNIVPPRKAGQLSAGVFRIVSTFLIEMDSIDMKAKKYPMTVIEAAEGKEGTDEAILRPGRLECHFELLSRLATDDRRELLRHRIPSGGLA